MAAKLSGGTAAAGVVAYQDDQDPEQFHYIPANADCILDETLADFSATYWGIGDAFYKQSGNRIESVVGATLAGRAAIEISDYQRSRIKAAIQLAYKVTSPKLVPMMLTDVSVDPVIGENTLSIGDGGDIVFPSTVQLGTTFNFLVGTGNSLFAQFVGAQASGMTVTPNPSFGINITGTAEFVGDPWEVEVEADLSQVWSYTREKFSAGIGWGWFRVSLGEYESTVMDMVKDQVVKLTFKEGSLDNEKYGRQILEMGREIYDAINAMGLSQEGFFKFEPNPDPPASVDPNSGMAWPFNFFINAGYGKQSIKSSQSTHYKQTISYTGRVLRTVPASMTLAVSCNLATSAYFRDLGYPNTPCITEEKVNTFQARMKAEAEKSNAMADKLFERWILGDITDEQYYAGMNKLYGYSPLESGWEVDPELLEDIPGLEGTYFAMGSSHEEILKLLLGL